MGGLPGTVMPFVPIAAAVVAPSFPLMPQAWPEVMVAEGARSTSRAAPSVGEVEGVEVTRPIADLHRGAGLVDGHLGRGRFGHATGRVVEIVDPRLRHGEGRRRHRSAC